MAKCLIVLAVLLLMAESSAPLPGPDAQEQPPRPSENRTNEAGEREPPGPLRQQPPEREAENRSGDRTNNGASHWYRNLPTLTAISAALGALATFLLVLVGAGQAFLYWQQHDTTKRLERPWVGVAVELRPDDLQPHASGLPTDSDASHRAIDYCVSNSGGSPAWITLRKVGAALVYHEGAYDLLTDEACPEPLYRDGDIENGIREPLAPTDARGTRKLLPIYGADRRAIYSHRGSIVLYGTLVYEGIFRGPWFRCRRPDTYTTNFYWIYKSTPEGWSWRAGPERFNRCT